MTSPRLSLALALTCFSPVFALGCAVGGPQIGPKTAYGQREHTISTSTYQGQHAAEGYHYVVDESWDQGTFGLGVMLGARVGASSVKVADARSSAFGLADEVHTDVMASWSRFGFGLEGTLGAETATMDKFKYSIGGWGASAFGQFSIVQPLFLTAGLGKQFGTVTRQNDDANDSNSISADASLIRLYGGVTWIFSDSTSTQWGAALQLRHTFSGNATAKQLDLSWKSTALLAEILFLKF